MMKWQHITLKGLLLFFIGILLTGCIQSKPTPPIHNSNGTLSGIHTTIQTEEKFTPKPIPSYYYGQFLVETKLYKNAVRGPNSQEFQDYLFKIFGTKQKQFGVSLAPIIDGIKLPNVILFSYEYDSRNNSWRSDYTPEYISPLIKLNSNTVFTYALQHHTSNNVQSSLVQKVNTIINDYSAIVPGAWTISAASRPIIEEVSQTADGLIGSFLSQSTKADLKSNLQPAFNGRKSQTVRISDDQGNPLADIRISIRLTNSLLNPQLEEISSDFMAAIPKMNHYIDPLNVIKISGQESRTVREDLNGAIQNLVTLTDPEAFGNSCQEMLNNTLQNRYGLTRFDALNVMRYLLVNSTKFSKSKSLYNSGCLSDEDLELLNLMNVPIKLNEEFLPYDPELYPEIGKLMQSPQDRSNVNHIKRFFSDDIFIVTEDNESRGLIEGYFPGNAYSKEDIITLFSEMNVARFCCIRRPSIEGESLKTGQQMFFRRAKEQTLYSMEFYRGTRNPLIKQIILKVIHDNEISQNERDTLLRSMREDEYY